MNTIIILLNETPSTVPFTLTLALVRHGWGQLSRRTQLVLAGSSPGRVVLHLACCLSATSQRQRCFCLAGIGREIRPVLRNLRLSLP